MKQYIKPTYPERPICRFSGKPLPLSFEENRQRVLDDIEASKGTDRVVYFCTNRMLAKGTVYHCRIDDNGVAVAFQKQIFWGMGYTEPMNSSKVLGAVTPSQISGQSRFCMSAGGLMQGQG